MTLGAMIRGNNGKDKQEKPGCGRRTPTFMSAEDLASGRKSHWQELEITGMVRNISPTVWRLKHLTALYMSENSLVCLPSEICHLTQLSYLDISNNKLRRVPAELGDLVNMRELHLNHNLLRILPYELGKLFQLQVLGLKGNPLGSEIMTVYQEQNGTQRLLTMMLNNLEGQLAGQGRPAAVCQAGHRPPAGSQAIRQAHRPPGRPQTTDHQAGPRTTRQVHRPQTTRQVYRPPGRSADHQAGP
ncbi:CCR4-NOT transcription complex subunit 6-like [Pollicipes pollicipes]|uniref:CCR4-NOT transcription complex subunit 6-like n=1 Tax=Pollicipes pollicipes TaxID=41117 RepID=UPI00188528C9|nr:CCR4-NOT transcription complex subunit 6-like [Pollicipes pollicipes]